MSILLTGLAASSGITIAPAHLLVESDLSIKKQHTADENHEVARLHDSFALSKTELQHLSKHAHELLGQRAVTIIDTQIAILDDPTLQKKIIDRINSHHDTAEWAVKRVEDYYLSVFERKNDNEYLYARATALRDVTKRVLSHLLNVSLPDPGLLDHRAIFVANNITPTDTAQFDKRYVAGIVTTNGGRTSHFTIMSKTLSLPAVVGVKNATTIIHDGDLLIVDGIHGKVIVNPTNEEIEHYRLLAGKFIQEQQKWGALKDKQTVSADGRRFEVGANVGTFADVIDAQEDGAEGIGLLRTEFLYMSKDELPTEEQQFNAYKRFVSAMNEQRVSPERLTLAAIKSWGWLLFLMRTILT